MEFVATFMTALQVLLKKLLVAYKMIIANPNLIKKFSLIYLLD